MHKNFQTIAFTHSTLDVAEVGLLHLENESQATRLQLLKKVMDWSELMFLSTCNRVEFFLVGNEALSDQHLHKLFDHLYPALSAEQKNQFCSCAQLFSGDAAIEHLFNVASSIDSMVVGEREIITQVRTAYDHSAAMGLTGDFLRLLTKQTIELAKKVYTQTDIAKNPVSVVSLAYHRMKELNIPLDARVLIIGAGVTNTTLARFLKKHGYNDFTVFNRTYSKAVSLATALKGKAFDLKEIGTYTGGFDVLIACTGTEGHIVTPAMYESLLQGDNDKKLVIDIAVPQDLDPSILAAHKVHHISVSYLQKLSDANLKERASQIESVKGIILLGKVEFAQRYKERTVELAMREVPHKIKEIKRTALDEVFKNDMEGLDSASKEVLENILGYMEKKYMSVPMLMAKEILLKSR